ncbi:hypothetical protein HHL11_24565 [Ramlibacter sp. G-1-2-2]|uniref:Guanylate cyclase domain-containing protein n=1 Tax=Ramlibacter agri TaxID=2728837 RepID=A0A848HBT8_9BURK|nr:adenylate/guanylate cyclase domain-containing protein [Ramlibacter agri]NML46940.1 hypothetical protein [Ramlibacter agri]
MSFSWVDATDFARHTKVIAVADVVESVRLMELDEQEFIQRWHGFVEFVKQHLPGESGRLHKSLGDGLMIEFGDPAGCVRATLAMQSWFNEGNQGLAAERHVHLRIGAHIAEFVSDEHDIYGTDVNLTARIATLAGPGEIVISAALRERLQDHPAVLLEDLGICHLKHVRQPVRAYRVGRAGRAPVLPAASAAGRLLTRATVAVLPFAGAPDGEGLGEAIADEAVAGLTRVPELQVVSRLTTAAFPLERASFLLRGHVRRAGEAVAVFAELGDIANSHIVWAHSFKGRTADLFSDDTALLRGLVAGVASGVMAREAERAQGQPFPSLSSPTLLFAGLAAMHCLASADLERSRAMLEELVERNPRQPAAHAWLSHWHLLQLRLGLAEDAQEHTAMARSHATAALQADGYAPLALCMDGQVKLRLLRDPDGAATRYAQVLRARADDSLGLLLQAELHAFRDEGAAAHRTAQRALALCMLAPLRYWYEQVAGLAALVAGDLPQALLLSESAVARQPEFAAAHVQLVAAQAAAGQHAGAKASLQRLLRVRPDFTLARMQADCPACDTVLRRVSEYLAQVGAPPG